MNMKEIRHALAAKGLPVARILRGWRTFVPDQDVYFVDSSGAIRRHDVKAAGGRRAFREALRGKRRARVAALKASSRVRKTGDDGAFIVDPDDELVPPELPADRPTNPEETEGDGA